MPPVYVDLDDVLCDTARAFLRILEQRYGKRVSFESISHFDLGISFGLGATELAEFLQIAHEPEELLAMQPVAGAVETLERWERAGHEIAVVTGRPAATHKASREWLGRHGVPHHSLTFVDKYSRPEDQVDGGPRPLELTELARRDYLFAIEDSRRMALFLASSTDVPVFLLDRPWNRRPLPEEAARCVTRCRDWAELEERVADLA